MADEEVPTFERELASLINRHSQENASGTPDFILAQYLNGCLEIFNRTVKDRAEWRGERLDSIFDVTYEKKIPINVYDDDGGPPNQIGQAQITVWPGETVKHGRVTGLVPIFDRPQGEDTNG